MAENTNQRIGDYEVIRELGHGGMGRVYEVRNVLSDRIEAMKVLLPDLAARTEFVDRFMREIKLLASLDHPNIAALRTAFTAGDQFVMIMEFVEGKTLADCLEQGSISTPDALNYIDQGLAALSYAHSKGVIHRDIKPANMMLTPQGVVKLMDFGIARSGSQFGLTATGETLGSLDYMSPEQVKSQPTDERSDLYSVGVSLYQMVTRQRMFSATSSFSIMEAHIKEIPRAPIELLPSLPKPVSDLIMIAVAKDPAQRFQSANAFRNAVAQVRAAMEESSNQPTAAVAAIVMPAPPLAASHPAAATSTSAPAAGSTHIPTAPVVAPPVAARASRMPWLIVAILLLAILAGAGAYFGHQHREAAQDFGAAPGQSAPPSSNVSNPTVQSAAPPPTAATTPPQAATSTPVAAPASGVSGTPAAVSGKKRSTEPGGSAATAMVPGGAAQDEPPPEPAVDPKKVLDELETENDGLESRAAAVESSLDALEQQMHRDGLGLRGDVVASRASMRNDLSKAKQALDGLDTDRARHYLDLAHHDVEKLETFLGRR